jgi:hypothetical protein
MGLNLSDHEQELRSQLCRPAWVALGLTNDLYSLDKERKAAKEMGEGHVCNALWVIMREHNVDEEAAARLCRQKISESVAEYAETVRRTRERADVSRDLRIFVEAIQYILSGNLAWTRGAPRYNPGATYNARQLDWMANGTPGSPGSQDTKRPKRRASSTERALAKPKSRVKKGPGGVRKTRGGARTKKGGVWKESIPRWLIRLADPGGSAGPD